MWYGQLMNNLVQGSAADLVRNALLTCKRQGLPVVFTAHDEIVLECPDQADRKALAATLKQVMEDIPAWARERRFNVKAECDVMYRYRK
jgi:DNA polymerase I-like protein with 3'-5' exonuclease and polymerase domains